MLPDSGSILRGFHVWEVPFALMLSPGWLPVPYFGVCGWVMVSESGVVDWGLVLGACGVGCVLRNEGLRGDEWGVVGDGW